ncbi:MAG: hypothetical protein P8Y36_13205 [Alphaproteobacteria bacterium]
MQVDSAISVSGSNMFAAVPKRLRINVFVLTIYILPKRNFKMLQVLRDVIVICVLLLVCLAYGAYYSTTNNTAARLKDDRSMISHPRAERAPLHQPGNDGELKTVPQLTTFSMPR